MMMVLMKSALMNHVVGSMIQGDHLCNAVTCKYMLSEACIISIILFQSPCLIMVIELSGVQFGLKSYAKFQNRTSAWRMFDLKSQCKYDFRPKLHNPRFNATLLDPF